MNDTKQQQVKLNQQGQHYQYQFEQGPEPAKQIQTPNQFHDDLKPQQKDQPEKSAAYVTS